MRLAPKALKYGVLLPALLICVFLTACSQKRIEFTMYVNTIPVNLDPQIASTPSEITSVLHLYNSLFRKGADGKVVACAAKDYSVSEDGLVYTITIKAEQKWHSYKINGVRVEDVLTASDFAFGISRVFDKDTKSPYVQPLSTIKNGLKVLDGALPPSALGVKATDEYTLQITLEHPDPLFIDKLCLPGTMPCTETFFKSTNGAYGLSGTTTLGNGDFELVTWVSDSGIGMKKASGGNGEINYLRLILPEKRSNDLTPIERLADGDTDGELIQGYVEDNRFSGINFATTVWTLCFNNNNKYLANADIRRALASCAENADLKLDGKSLLASEGLVPPSISMLEKNYREYAGNLLLPVPNAAATYRSGLEQLGISKVSGLTVLVPSDGEYAEYFEEIAQQWQKDLSVFFSVKKVSRAELDTAVAGGNYDIALIPLSQSENDVSALLARFKSTSSNNPCAYKSEPYDSLLKSIELSRDSNKRADLYVAAEKLILSDAPIVPLFYETGTFLYSSDISNLVVSPYGPIIDVSFAIKKT
ncbi:MAG: peptide ABC transporter substrate-binding protein [Oscillospiraceae bacterium]